MSQSTQINVRIDTPVLDKIDQFRRAENDLPNRPEAIRRLVERCLGPSEATHQQPNNADSSYVLVDTSKDEEFDWGEHRPDEEVAKFIDHDDALQFLDR